MCNLFPFEKIYCLYWGLDEAMGTETREDVGCEL